MSPEDKRLVAALTLLDDRINPMISEIFAGKFGEDERRAFAVVLATLAGELDPGLVVGRRQQLGRP